MISDADASRIAKGWIGEYAGNKALSQERERKFFFELDDLIYRHPLDALKVFECVGRDNLANWTFEGFAAGPLRTFLMLHSNKFVSELNALREQSVTFDSLCALAVEGL